MSLYSNLFDLFPGLFDIMYDDLDVSSFLFLLWRNTLFEIQASCCFVHLDDA